MLLQLPTFNARLEPCPASAADFTPHAAGSFCGSCQRVVHDFSRSTNPQADLTAAHAASPDGRVCGTFRASQVVTVPPTLTRRLRWFLLALVLVVGQGLTAQEAWAQVRRAKPRVHAAPAKKQLPKPLSEEVPEVLEFTSGIAYPVYTEDLALTGNEVYTNVDQMPVFQGGGAQELATYIERHVRWPRGLGTAEVEGQVSVSFIVGKEGLVRDVVILKELNPHFDAEVLRVVQALPAFIPGRKNGQPVAVRLSLPVTFQKQKE